MQYTMICKKKRFSKQQMRNYRFRIKCLLEIYPNSTNLHVKFNTDLDHILISKLPENKYKICRTEINQLVCITFKIALFADLLTGTQC